MRVTEQSSKYNNLDKMSTLDLLVNMNNEDKQVPVAVEKCIPNIEKLVDGIVERMGRGGRLFYLGAGTSGRLGILDASEIPPTFGAPYDLVIGLIAGGDKAIRRAVEAAEDRIISQKFLIIVPMVMYSSSWPKSIMTLIWSKRKRKSCFSISPKSLKQFPISIRKELFIET